MIDSVQNFSIILSNYESRPLSLMKSIKIENILIYGYQISKTIFTQKFFFAQGGVIVLKQRKATFVR